MKLNLSHINETLHQQSFEIRQQLAAVFEEQKRALERAGAHIDDKLRESALAIAEYRSGYESLNVMRQKLVQLGGDPSAMPPSFPVESLEEAVAVRLRALRDAGKL
jgi:hypothetical protein